MDFTKPMPIEILVYSLSTLIIITGVLIYLVKINKRAKKNKENNSN